MCREIENTRTTQRSTEVVNVAQRGRNAVGFLRRDRKEAERGRDRAGGAGPRLPPREGREAVGLWPIRPGQNENGTGGFHPPEPPGSDAHV